MSGERDEIAAAEKRGAERVIARVEALCDESEQLMKAEPWGGRWPAMAYTSQIRDALRESDPQETP